MKRLLYKTMCFVCMTAACMLHSCTADDEMMDGQEGSVVYPKLKIGVSAMDMVAVSRAASPMSPDLEKYVRTIAVFEFDNEGLHEKGDDTYHFIDFIKGTVDGVEGVGSVHKTEYGIVETTLDGLALKDYSSGTLCLVANVTEEEVDEFYDGYRESGQSYGSMTLARFKTWALPFTYVQSESGEYDESTTGYVSTMYMFGYYGGAIDPSKVGEIRLNLGRLASRIDITIVNDTGGDIKKRLAYHFDKVCQSAYFFPILSGMPPTIDTDFARTVICAGENDPVEGDPDFKIVPEIFPADGVHTRYYYVAAHSAEGYDDATKLHMFYDRHTVDDDTGDTAGSAWVPLCNVHPLHAAGVTNGYSLSRNTRYHFTIRLKSKAVAPASRAMAAGAVEMEYGDAPGDITLYLSDL